MPVVQAVRFAAREQRQVIRREEVHRAAQRPAFAERFRRRAFVKIRRTDAQRMHGVTHELRLHAAHVAHDGRHRRAGGQVLIRQLPDADFLRRHEAALFLPALLPPSYHTAFFPSSATWPKADDFHIFRKKLRIKPLHQSRKILRITARGCILFG